MRRLLILLLPILLAGGGLLYWIFAPQTRFIRGLALLSEEEALLVTRRNEDNATYRWVELHHKTKGPRWTIDTGELEVSVSLGFVGAASDEERIYLALEKSGINKEASELWALQRESGEILWKAELPGGTFPIAEILYVTNGLVLVLLESSGPGSTVHAFDAKTGEPRWKSAPIERVSETAIIKDQLFFFSPYLTLAINLSDGKQSQQIQENNCLLGDSLIIKEKRSLQRAWLKTEAPPQLFSLNPQITHVQNCWLHKDNIALMWDDYPDSSIAAIHQTTGEVAWSLALKGLLSMREEPFTREAKAVRYVPLALTETIRDDQTKTRLGLLDLEGKKMRLLQEPEASLSWVGHVGSQWLLVNRYSTLLLIDGETGELRAAWKANWDLGALGPTSLRGDTLWIYGAEWATQKELPWVIVSLSQAKVIHTQGEMGLTDETAIWREYFSKMQPIGEPTTLPASSPASTQATSLP